MDPSYMELVQIVKDLTEALNTTFTTNWHPAGEWLVLLMVILNSLAIIWLVVYLATSKKLIDTIARSPLTEGRDMKQDFLRAI